MEPKTSPGIAPLTQKEAGETIRTIRTAKLLTQQELADRVGVDISFISLLEAGKRNIRNVGYETVLRIAHALDVEPQGVFPVAVTPPPRSPRKKARSVRARRRGRAAA